MTINERLVELRKSLKIKQGEFAQKIGMKQSTLSTMELGNSPVSDRYIKLICLTFGINEQWLRAGAGEMLSDLVGEEDGLITMYRHLSPAVQKAILDLVRTLYDTEQRSP
jgi:transcriptional regulator with XRE-family HTH domain